MSDKPISYQPTDGLSYDPTNEHYWSSEALGKELSRAFEICHGCRMCFKYCDSFPTLFSLIDDRYDGDVRKITAADTAQVMSACFQCKLCEVQCPYTPREGHAYMLDFPRLVHRYWAQQTKEDGGDPTLRDKFLRDPDWAGRLARMSFGLANAMNRVPAHRWLMEKVLGVHRDKLLPDFASETFERWAEKHGRIRSEPKAEVVLFQTCYVQNNEPELGRDTLFVFDKNQIDTACVRGLACCGMPAWERGDLEGVRQRARQNLDVLMPFVDAGAKVIAINPTCSMMMRREWPELLAGDDRERARRMADAVRDPGEYLWSIRNEARFCTDLLSTPGTSVAYHAPCHLRAQGIGFKGRDLLRKIPGVVPTTVMECCGHDGTYAMTVDGFEPSQRIGQKSFAGMKEPNARVWVTECPLAAKQFEQHAGNKALHPMTVLAWAYRPDGFEAGPAPKEE